MGDIFSSNQRYRQVGNQIETILADLDLNEAGFALKEPQNFVAILALVTLFQHEEGFTDVQAAEAVRTRSDWKYALGLPLSYPGFDSGWLCRFREHALQSRSTRDVIQNLADRVGKTGGNGAIQGQALRAEEMLYSICRFNRIVQVTDAILLAVEALAARGSTWPSTLPLSNLYASYAKIFHTIQEIRDPVEVTGLGRTIGADIAALLGSIDASGETELKAMPEICNLRKIWTEQYDPIELERAGEPATMWRMVDCLRCSVKTCPEYYALERLGEPR